MKRARTLLRNEMTSLGKSVHEIADEAHIVTMQSYAPSTIRCTRQAASRAVREPCSGRRHRQKRRRKGRHAPIYGKARVFNSEDEAMQAILAGSVSEGQVVSCAMRAEVDQECPKCLRQPPRYRNGAEPYPSLQTGVLGGTRAPHRHISPEAARVAPWALARRGRDTIDIPNHRLAVQLTDEVLAARKATVDAGAKRHHRRYLKRYAAA